MYGPPPSSQAKNEADRQVCANVFGLSWSTVLLARMECAALSSYLSGQPSKTFSHSRFRKRRVGPLCHLAFASKPGRRKQNTVAAGLRMWESRSDFQAWPQPSVICRLVRLSQHSRVRELDKLLPSPVPPKPCARAYSTGRRRRCWGGCGPLAG